VFGGRRPASIWWMRHRLYSTPERAPLCLGEPTWDRFRHSERHLTRSASPLAGPVAALHLTPHPSIDDPRLGGASVFVAGSEVAGYKKGCRGALASHSVTGNLSSRAEEVGRMRGGGEEGE